MKKLFFLCLFTLSAGANQNRSPRMFARPRLFKPGPNQPTRMDWVCTGISVVANIYILKLYWESKKREIGSP